MLTSLDVSFNVPIQLDTGCNIDLKVPDDFTDLK